MTKTYIEITTNILSSMAGDIHELEKTILCLPLFLNKSKNKLLESENKLFFF